MIGIVACSKQKLAHKAPARELYTSQLFRLSLAYAEHVCDVVYVVSALHGLVKLDTELEPYDFEMSDRGGKRYREAWGERVASALIALHGKSFTTVSLAGQEYTQPIARGLYTHFGFGDSGWRGAEDRPVIEPLAGMQIGQRLSWLSKHNAQNNARKGIAL